jgi:hypothetical protein
MKLKPVFPKSRAEDLDYNFGFILECVALEALLIEQCTTSNRAVLGLAYFAGGLGAKLCRAI